MYWRGTQLSTSTVAPFYPHEIVHATTSVIGGVLAGRRQNKELHRRARTEVCARGGSRVRRLRGDCCGWLQRNTSTVPRDLQPRQLRDVVLCSPRRGRLRGESEATQTLTTIPLRHTSSLLQLTAAREVREPIWLASFQEPAPSSSTAPAVCSSPTTRACFTMLTSSRRRTTPCRALRRRADSHRHVQHGRLAPGRRRGERCQDRRPETCRCSRSPPAERTAPSRRGGRSRSPCVPMSRANLIRAPCLLPETACGLR